MPVFGSSSTHGVCFFRAVFWTSSGGHTCLPFSPSVHAFILLHTGTCIAHGAHSAFPISVYLLLTLGTLVSRAPPHPSAVQSCSRGKPKVLAEVPQQVVEYMANNRIVPCKPKPRLPPPPPAQYHPKDMGATSSSHMPYGQ